MKIAFIVPDNRENFRQYDLQNPCFGTAPTALLEGFSMVGDHPEEPEIHVISCTQKRIPAPEKLASNIWFHSLHVPKAGWLRSGYLGCALAVRKKLREIHPDLVHAQGTERDCAVSAVLSPYPKILTIHGNLRLIKKQVGFRPFSAMWFQSFLEGFAVPRFDGVICITNYTKNAVEHEVPKTWVVPNAVDPAFLALGEKRMRRHEVKNSEINDSGFRFQVSGSESPPIILCVANVDPRKNQNAFIKALDPLAKQMKFEIRFFGECGDSDYAREFKELIGLRPWCHYGGMIGRKILRDQFEQTDMLALPTHEDNCPMVVLEAMAAGVPVIASRVGGIPDLIDGMKTGLFCDPWNSSSFPEGVSQILGNSNLAGRLARNAHEEALRRFHPKVIAKRHLEIYQQVLGR
jgi:glycosyltransferase involved in cell wall biosynthesis